MPKVAALAAILAAGMALGAQAAELTGCYATPPAKDAQHPEFAIGQSLVLAQSAGNQLEFHFVDVGANGHLCIAHGVAKLARKERGSTYLFSAAEAKDSEQGTPSNPGPACELRITPTRQAVSIAPFSGDCHSYFSCGARAGVGGEFKRSTRTPLGTNGCKMLEP